MKTMLINDYSNSEFGLNYPPIRGQQMGQINFRKPDLITSCRMRGTSANGDCKLHIYTRNPAPGTQFKTIDGTEYYKLQNGAVVRVLKKNKRPYGPSRRNI